MRIEGPSPQARGNPVRISGNGLPVRPIPVCAGQPIAVFPECRACAAHPRGRGVTARPMKNSTGPMGPSPQARGKRLEDRDGLAPRRPIPSGAGYPPAKLGDPKHCLAHPRWRGVTYKLIARAYLAQGQSPRARGNPRGLRIEHDKTRPIPVHGVTETTHPMCDQHPGLSPRARGNHRPAHRRCVRRRPIPACTG